MRVIIMENIESMDNAILVPVGKFAACGKFTQAGDLCSQWSGGIWKVHTRIHELDAEINRCASKTIINLNADSRAHGRHNV